MYKFRRYVTVFIATFVYLFSYYYQCEQPLVRFIIVDCTVLSTGVPRSRYHHGNLASPVYDTPGTQNTLATLEPPSKIR